MTFLELCQRLRQEVGVAGTGPLSVAGQSGEYARLVSWIITSWQQLDTERRYRFDWSQGTIALNATDTEYSLPADFDVWADDTLRFGNDRIEVVPWSELESGADRFARVAIAPDVVLHLNASPKANDALTFEYWRTPQMLVNDADVPRLPERYHMAIVYRAMLQYAMYENAPEVAQQAQMNDQRIMQQIVRSELPSVASAGPLA